MKTHPIFKPDAPADLDRLIATHPFALVISSATGTPFATPLPLLLERDANGEMALLGHMPRADPHTDLLRSSRGRWRYSRGRTGTSRRRG